MLNFRSQKNLHDNRIKHLTQLALFILLFSGLVCVVSCSNNTGNNTRGDIDKTIPSPVFTIEELVVPGFMSARRWSEIAISTDGSIFAAADYYGDIYLSSDGGMTWVPKPGSIGIGWVSLALSHDGSTIAAASNDNEFIVTDDGDVIGGTIAVSSDFGETWLNCKEAGERTWADIAISGDGKALAAVATSESDTGDFICTSTDGGESWTEQTQAGQRFWMAITSSLDGTRLAAADSGQKRDYTTVCEYNEGTYDCWMELTTSYDGGYIYTSDDGGATWMERTEAGSRGWRAMVSSLDGMALYAIADDEYVYASLDGGETWTAEVGMGDLSYNSIALTAESEHSSFLVTEGFPIESTESIRENQPVGYGSLYEYNGFDSTWVELPGWEDKHFLFVSASPDSQNLMAIQSIDSLSSYDNFIVTSSNYGEDWTPARIGGRYWSKVCISDDGSHLVAIVYEGNIYVSKDGGMTWSEKDAPDYYRDMAMSRDGSKIVVSSEGSTLISSDYGATWFTLDMNTHSVACSANGLFIVASGQGNILSISYDGGESWTEKDGPGTGSMSYIISDSDGTKLVGINRYIYTSFDRGETWVQRTTQEVMYWESLSSSADGQTLVATGYGQMYISYDFGVSWEIIDTTITPAWHIASISADGQLIAASAGDSIFTSRDHGLSWSYQAYPDSLSHESSSIALSGDGSVFAVTGSYMKNIFIGKVEQ